MRLLHTEGFYFKEFIGREKPAYAIISHRWSDEEVSYEDFIEHFPWSRSAQRSSGRPSEVVLPSSYGWTKIAKACEIANAEDLAWVWIDTCCKFAS